MNFYKKVNEFLYKIDVCDMEILIDGQINMIFYNIYGKKIMDLILISMGYNSNKGW